MKYLLILLSITFASASAIAQEKETKLPAQEDNKKIMIVDAACGECKLGLKGKSCDLAVRINAKSYFVGGTDIDKHGDAHAKDGFCNAIRKAEVQGEVVGDRFKATYFKLLPQEVKKN